MKNDKYTTKGIVEAGIMTGIVVILMLIAAYIPMFGIGGILLLPVPITIIYLRHGFKEALLSIIVSDIIVSTAYDPILTLSLAILYGSTALTLGYCIKRKLKFGKIIMILTLVNIVAMIANVLLVSIITSNGIGGLSDQMQVLINNFKGSIEKTKAMGINSGLGEESLARYDEMISVLNVDYMLKLMAGAITIYALISAYINYIICRKILGRLGYEVEKETPVSMINFDAKIGLVVILFVLIGTILTYYKIPAGEYFYNSSNYVLQTIFVIQGISVIVYFLRNKFNIHKGIIIAMLILLFSIISQIAIFIGLGDLIFDFRKINKNRVNRK
ncbi:MAG: YybS family protein [Clostridiaceae bacterium]